MNASIIRRIEKSLAGAGFLCGRTGIWRDPGRYEKGQDKNYCTHVLSTFERITNVVHSEYNTGSPGRAGPKCGRHVLLVSEWSPCAPEIVAGDDLAFSARFPRLSGSGRADQELNSPSVAAPCTVLSPQNPKPADISGGGNLSSYYLIGGYQDSAWYGKR